MNTSEIENILKNSPKVRAPADLLGDLQRQIALPRTNAHQQTVIAPFWKRWFPALSFGLLILGCLVVLGIQTAQLLELQRENDQLQQAVQSAPPAPETSSENSTAFAAGDQAELERLRAEVEQLRAELQGFPEMRAQQDELRTQLNVALAKEAAEDPFAAPKAKADSVACISNLKQIGLAARMWANDNREVFPTDFITMRNELNTPRILVCPADITKLPAPSQWEQFNPSQVSYQFFGTTAEESDPSTVLTRCNIHGNIGMADGSAIMNTGTNLNLVTENGRLKLVRSKP